MDDEFRYALDALSDEKLAMLAADKTALRRMRPVGVSNAEALAMIVAIQTKRAKALEAAATKKPAKPRAPRPTKPRPAKASQAPAEPEAPAPKTEIAPEPEIAPAPVLPPPAPVPEPAPEPPKQQLIPPPFDGIKQAPADTRPVMPNQDISPTFVLMGNHKYYHLIDLNIARIHAVYPQARVIFYDWGNEDYTPAYVPKAHADKIRMVDWGQSIKDISALEAQFTWAQQVDMAIRYNARFQRSLSQRVRKKILKSMPASPWGRPLVRAGLVFENMLTQKIPCMIDASARIGDAPMVFLDADAFLLRKIDEVTGRDDFDVGLTFINQRCFDENKCNVINSGVLFFGRRAEQRRIFLSAWNQACQSCTEWLKEQTSMVRMLQAKAPRLFQTSQACDVDFDALTVTVQPLPLAVYNNTDHACLQGADESLPAIVHFANTAHNDAYFRQLSAQLEDAARRAQ